MYDQSQQPCVHLTGVLLGSSFLLSLSKMFDKPTLQNDLEYIIVVQNFKGVDAIYTDICSFGGMSKGPKNAYQNAKTIFFIP